LTSPTLLLLYNKLYFIISSFAKYWLSYSITKYWFSKESNIFDYLPNTDLLSFINLLIILTVYSMFSFIFYKSVVDCNSIWLILYDYVELTVNSFNFFSKFCLNVKFYYYFSANVLLALMRRSTLFVMSFKS
jgi:hypothetical protein